MNNNQNMDIFSKLIAIKYGRYKEKLDELKNEKNTNNNTNNNKLTIIAIITIIFNQNILNFLNNII
jgi:hypothetical protein